MKSLQFDVEARADGLRIYARLGQEIVGALDVENCDVRMDGRTSAAIIYVVPRWRSNGIEDALVEYLALHAANRPFMRT
jgi:ribosomal protein S18 acetylase RimI-like enzyme